MSYELKTDSSLSKEEKYSALIPQINSLIEDEINFIANLANITSALKYSFEDFLWVGFYLRDENKKDEIVLGPFQGRVACTRIVFGKGVCGTSALRKETIIVENVDKFPGHIVCDSLSKSEIVIPVVKNGETVAVLDIDSDKLSNFDQTDRKFLEEIVRNINHIF
ncbi:MAG TPA: GAF domain-containing protein [Ignavibacteria bacterium]|nr:GAF domain-containing protein [Ignavibacteria bacterium]